MQHGNKGEEEKGTAEKKHPARDSFHCVGSADRREKGEDWRGNEVMKG